MSEQQPQRGSRSAAEWVSFAIASVVLVAIVASIGVLWARDDQPASLAVDVSAAEQRGSGAFYVPVRVRNTGDRTAAAVQVVAELSADGDVVEEGEQTIDFLAGGDDRELLFVFTTDPGAAELDVRAASFAKP